MSTRILLAAVAALVVAGCAEFDMKKNIPWGAGVDGELKPPMKVAAIWTDTVLNVANQPSKRGFGGRLMFYTAEGGKPVKVKGTLHVYAFDETNRDTEKVKPDRKYVFTTEQFDKHYSKSALGHSYSVWIPWDEAGGPRREISLLVRFVPENGPAVIGEASRQLLPGYSENDPTQYADAATPGGPAAAVNAAAPATPSAVQPASYVAPQPIPPQPAPAAPASSGPKRMSTTTINLPSAGPYKPSAAPGPQPNTGAMYVAPQAAPPQTGLPAVASTTAAASTKAIGASAATPAVAPGAEPAAQLQGHFGPQRRRPLGEPLARLNRDHAPWQPSR
jgi:hypothetical protein